MQLRRWEQALLHLSDYDGDLHREGTLPYALTQSGVGQSLGISRSQANQILNYLETRRMVSSERHHVKGVRCMVRCYFIENRGRDEVGRSHERLGDDLDRERFSRAEVNVNYLNASRDFLKVSYMLEKLSRNGETDRLMPDIMELVNDAMNEMMEGSE